MPGYHLNFPDFFKEQEHRLKEGLFGLLKGSKSETHIYAVYKTPTSDLGTHSD